MGASTHPSGHEDRAITGAFAPGGARYARAHHEHIHFPLARLRNLRHQPAPRLAGEAALAAFYLNELTLRLAPRSDPLPTLHAAYARTRAALADVDAAALAWRLRCYERDLLEAIGFGFDWHLDGDGAPIDPAARYRLDPEHGPRRLLRDRGREERNEAATGLALLALAGDHKAGAADLASLRRPMRVLIAHHLGGRGLKSWELATQLRRLQPRD